MKFDELRVISAENASEAGKWETGYFADTIERLKSFVECESNIQLGKLFFKPFFNKNCDYLFCQDEEYSYKYFYPVKPKEDSDMTDELKSGDYIPRIGDVFVFKGNKVKCVHFNKCSLCALLDNGCGEIPCKTCVGTMFTPIDSECKSNGYKIDLSWLRGEARKVVYKAILEKALEKGFHKPLVDLSDFARIYLTSKGFVNADYNKCNKTNYVEISVNQALKGDYANAVTDKNSSTEKKYRPFKDAYELVDFWDKKINNHSRENTMPLIWIKYKGNQDTELITSIYKDADKPIGTSEQNLSFKEMFSNYTFIDGTPCGVVV